MRRTLLLQALELYLVRLGKKITKEPAECVIRIFPETRETLGV
jgi:hypothetical protein